MSTLNIPVYKMVGPYNAHVIFSGSLCMTSRAGKPCLNWSYIV